MGDVCSLVMRLWSQLNCPEASTTNRS